MPFAIVAYKSCHLQLLHTKVIAALMQFCDFFQLSMARKSIHCIMVNINVKVCFLIICKTSFFVFILIKWDAFFLENLFKFSNHYLMACDPPFLCANFDFDRIFFFKDLFLNFRLFLPFLSICSNNHNS